MVRILFDEREISHSHGVAKQCICLFFGSKAILYKSLDEFKKFGPGFMSLGIRALRRLLPSCHASLDTHIGLSSV